MNKNFLGFLRELYAARTKLNFYDWSEYCEDIGFPVDEAHAWLSNFIPRERSPDKKDHYHGDLPRQWRIAENLNRCFKVKLTVMDIFKAEREGETA